MVLSIPRRCANAAGLALVLAYSAADLWAKVATVRALWLFAVGG